MTSAVRWRRRAAVSGAVTLALVLIWLLTGWFVIVHPRTDRVTHADAIVVLGSPVVNGRLEVAQRLIAEQVSTNLVISINSPKQYQARLLCESPPHGVNVTCFTPDPATTRGEAEQVARLVRQHGWRSVVVVTSTYHISRARMIFRRCFDGDLAMVAARQGIGLGAWAYQYLYQSAAYLKAGLQSGC